MAKKPGVTDQAINGKKTAYPLSIWTNRCSV